MTSCTDKTIQKIDGATTVVIDNRANSRITPGNLQKRDVGLKFN